MEKNIRLRGQIELEEDLHKTLTLISSKWKMQNNRKDQQTGFIYRTQSLEECLRQIEKTGVDKNYALHRWYNFKTSVQCEYIFCEYGAIHDTNVYNHDVDIYINHVPEEQFFPDEGADLGVYGAGERRWIARNYDYGSGKNIPAEK